MARIARKPHTKRPARRAAGRTVNVDAEEPYEEDEGYEDKLADAAEPEPPEDAEDLEVELAEDEEFDDSALIGEGEGEEEEEDSGNRGARFALDRGFAAIDEARRREQRGERGD